MHWFWKSFYNLVLLPLSFPFFLLAVLVNKKLCKSFPVRFSAPERLEFKLMNRQRNKIIWFHLASSGEFLMTQPLVQQIREKIFHVTFVYTFTSPSGVEWLEKNNPEEIFDYYPYDNPFHIDKLFKAIRPAALIFIKYDVWANLIWLSKRYNVPTFLVSATIKKNSPKLSNPIFSSFFKSFYRDIDYIFPMNQESKKKFVTALSNEKSVKFYGDIKIDSTLSRQKIMKAARKSEQMEKTFVLLKTEFSQIIVGASTWQTEHKWLIESFQKIVENSRTKKSRLLILAAHEPNEKHLLEIEALCTQFSLVSMRLSDLPKRKKNANVLLIDQVGVLNAFFELADFAMVGLGRGGLHNFLEPISWQVATTFRVGEWKDWIADEIVKKKWITPVNNWKELYQQIDELLKDHPKRKELAKNSLQFLIDKGSLSEKIATNVVKLLKVSSR